MVAPSGTDKFPPATDSGSPTRLRFSPWSIVRGVLIVVVVAVGVGVVGAAATPLWWLAIATALAGALQPATLWLRRFLPGWLAIVIVVVVVMAFVGFLGYRGFAEMSSQFVTLQDNAINAAKDLELSRQFGEVTKEFGLVDKTTRFFATLPLQLGGGDATSAVQNAATSGGALFAIATLALLMMVFGRRLVRSAIDQIPEPVVASRVRSLVFDAYRASSRYVWLMALRALVIGVLAGTGCGLVGMQAPTAIGVWFAVFSLIPAVGFVVASIPIAVYEGITSIPLAILIFALAMLVQLLDSMYVMRRIERTSIRLGPGLTLVAVLFGGQLYGIGGALVLLAIAVFTVAFVRLLTPEGIDVFTAFRALVRVDGDVDAALEAGLEPPNG